MKTFEKLNFFQKLANKSKVSSYVGFATELLYLTKSILCWSITLGHKFSVCGFFSRVGKVKSIITKTSGNFIDFLGNKS